MFASKVKFKGLEDRTPPEDVEQTKDPNDVESHRFFENDFISIILINDNGELTKTDISKQIRNLFDDNEIKQNDDNENEIDIDIDNNYLF